MTDALAVGREVSKRVVKTEGHKYQADLPDSLWTELQHLAAINRTTVADLIRRFVKLGIVIADLEESGGYLVLKRPGHDDERIMLLV